VERPSPRRRCPARGPPGAGTEPPGRHRATRPAPSHPAGAGAIRWRDGLPLDAGRAARTEPPGLRRALEARDRGCRRTGCGALAAWATAHHIRPWSKGGATSLAGLALFCYLHHPYFIHILGWTVTGDPDGTLHFTHPGSWLTLHSPLPSH
jgi:hypothetical protein